MNKEKEHNCPHCGMHESQQEQEPGEKLLKGWRLGLSSATVFLLPLIGALIGVILLKGLPGGEIVGLLAGLVAGTALAIFLSRYFKIKKK